MFFATQVVALISMSFLPLFAGPFERHGEERQSSQELSFLMETDRKFLQNSQDRKRLIQRIWQRESHGNIAGLTAWNQGEDFASVGFNHSLWQRERKSTINYFAEFAHVQGLTNIPQELSAPLPDYLNTQEKWQNALDDAATQTPSTHAGKKLHELQKFFLRDEVQDLQLDFILQDLQQFRRSLFTAVNKVTDEDRRARWQAQLSAIEANYDWLARDESSFLAMFDYLSFKGNGFEEGNISIGLSSRNVTLDTHWGLLQVLARLDRKAFSQDPLKAFTQAGSLVLQERAERWQEDKKWILGWTNRLSDYRV
jgi:hypothetical protein